MKIIEIEQTRANRIRVNVTAAPGNGIAVLFDQFLVGPADCIFACDTAAMGCDRYIDASKNM